MAQQTLQDLLGRIQKEAGEVYQKAFDGGPSGNWDVDLPVTQEFRGSVIKSEYAPAKKSGVKQIVLTLEVQEPAEFAGAMLQDYINPNPTQSWQVEQLAKTFGAYKVSLAGHDDFDTFAGDFTGKTVVFAVRKWGDDLDRNAVRYYNQDTGQNLRSNVKPKKERTDTSALRPDIVIPKDETPAPAAVTPPPAAEAPAPSPQTTTALPGGVNLPPGIRQS